MTLSGPEGAEAISKKNAPGGMANASSTQVRIRCEWNERDWGKAGRTKGKFPSSGFQTVEAWNIKGPGETGSPVGAFFS
jgi:hypothetical protein